MVFFVSAVFFEIQIFQFLDGQSWKVFNKFHLIQKGCSLIPSLVTFAFLSCLWNLSNELIIPLQVWLCNNRKVWLKLCRLSILLWKALHTFHAKIIWSKLLYGKHYHSNLMNLIGRIALILTRECLSIIQHCSENLANGRIVSDFHTF